MKQMAARPPSSSPIAITPGSIAILYDFKRKMYITVKMYSSLQEAYQVPSFASRKKSKTNSGSANVNVIEEGFTSPSGTSSTKDMTGSQDIDNIAYTVGQASDFQYYSNKGMKFPKIASAASAMVEPFDDAAPTCASPDTTYRIPISDASKTAYDAAMNIAISEQQSGAGAGALPKPAAVQPMPTVSGYYDEDLEQYLRTADMKAAPALKYKPGPYDIPTPSLTEDSSPFAEAMGRFDGQMHPPGTATAPKANSSGSTFAAALGGGEGSDVFKVYILDLILFILCGLIVIFLCDQLYRLATMVGMRDTIDFIRPFMDE